MVRREFVKGYENFLKLVEELFKDGKTKLFIYFSGEKDSKGQSWCPDCNQAEPFVKQAVEKYADNDSIFLMVDVGNRSYWKDMKNPYRMDKLLKLMVIPTILRWKRVERLEGPQCNKLELLELLFDDDS